jgi:hypothetical protein
MTVHDRPDVQDQRPALPAVSALTRDFLAWVAGGTRTYVDAMEAWRTSCPRFTIWEDAVADRLIRLDSDGATMTETRVVLTARGTAILDAR